MAGTKSQESARVVIIGAGISGLAAAEKLLQHGFKNIQILEARNRIGGRVNTVKIGEFAFEAGAQWIHGSENNILLKLAKENNIKTLLCDRSKVEVLTEHGQKLTGSNLDMVVEAKDKFEEICAEADALRCETPHKNFLSFVTAAWNKYWNASKIHENKMFDTGTLFEGLRYYMRSYEGGDCLADLCVATDYVNLGEYDALVACGFSEYTKLIEGNLPFNVIELNCEVTCIKWNLFDKSSSDSAYKFQHPVLVKCKSEGKNQDSTADHVIVTIPVGCLKQNHKVLFNPNLPTEKVSAMERIGYGIVNKVVLQFDEAFWDKDTTEIFLLWNELNNSKHWWRVISRFYVFRDFIGGKQYLLTFLTGQEALEMEKYTNEEVGSICHKLLQTFTGMKDLSQPTLTYATRWGTDPYSQGSYTNYPVGSCGLDFDAMSQPVPGSNCPSNPIQLLFAGEGTIREFYSTVHGAYLSGQREAQRIIDYYGNK